jgi:predicted outer membrane repeat protein
MKTKSFAPAILCMGSCMLFLATAATAMPRYHVRAGASGDGSTWDHAGGDLQAAIDSGVSEVWVATGIYFPSSWPNGGSTDREKHFALRDGVTVLGGFPDAGDPAIEERDPVIYPTICSGDIGTIGVSSDNVYHVFYHPPDITGSAVLDGFTITGGNASESSINGQGAGMHNNRSSPTLIRCVFIGNAAKFEGGGVYQTTSETSFDHCVFYQNSSGVAGGGVYNELSKTIFSHGVFAGNTAPFGGAIRNLNSSSSQILSCTFHNNTGLESGGGGGIHNETDSSAEVSNSILWGDSEGEVVDLIGCVSIVRYCTIQGGWTGDGGDNSSSDPLFAGSGVPEGPDYVWATGDDGLRLTGSSPALDMGSAGLLPADAQDLDRDGITMEPSPFDLRMLPRIAGTGLDQGAYEFQYPTVTFELAGHATRTGGGDLVQELKEGVDATAPILAVDLGWSFTGWDQLFTHVFADRTVTALYTATFAPGSICYVRQGGTGNGSTWDLAAGNIQQAIDAISAAGGGQVWVGAGIYLPSSWPNGGGAAREKHFSLRNGVTVLGGFPATGTPALPDRNPPACPTVLSGDLGVEGAASDNAYHVFYHSGITLDSSARLDGVTITGGKANGSGVHEYGAGMYNNACSPTLVRCVFTANASNNQAGGLYLGSSSAMVVNCVFANNSAINEGGALYIYQSTPVLANCLFSGNSALFGSAAFLYLGGPASFISSTFSGNSSGSGASTIHLSSSSAALSNCILWNNPNGGINDSAAATLNYCIIEDGWTGPGSNNIGTDPLFANASDPDGIDNRWATTDDGLHPGTLGSAFNSGDPSRLPADLTDLDGDGDSAEALPLELASQPRIRGAQLDRGAHETSAAIIYHVRSGGAGNGLTWLTAMGDPQDAIEAAALEGYSQVWIAAGIYLPDSWPNGGSADREKHFALRNGVPVFGGFPGTGTPAMIDRNPALNLTVFSGDLGTTGVNTDNAYHVFYHPYTALDSSARLDGVTITGGNANGTSNTHLNGAGMYNYDSAPALVRCYFKNNSANTRGGALYLQDSLTSVVSCIFSGNSANEGGACYSGNPRDTSIWANCIFSNNSAVSGGALYFPTKGSARFINCTFVANSGNGGAINNDGSQPVFDNSIIWGNTPNQIIENLGHTTLNYCIIQGGWSGDGSNNTSDDPLFVNAGNPEGADGLWGTADDGLQPTATSPAINSGDQTLLPFDLADLDGDDNSTEVLPCDLNQRPRVRDVQVDRGAYEPLSPVIFHVKSGGAGNGFTWATAMGDPQAAIEAAATATHSQVWIAAGIYLPGSWPNGGSADPREKHFALRNGVPVYGGFPATGDPALIDRNPSVNLTVFSGNIGLLENPADNTYHVFYHPGGSAALDSSARLDGVRITGGNANIEPGFVYGAGMFNSQSSPMIVRCVFYDNTSASQAGGLYLGNSSNSPVVNCVFSDNHAEEGGGIFVYEAEPVLSNCLFVSNTAGATGGGVRAYSDGNPTFINCTFTANSNGALSSFNSTVSFSNCILWGNLNYQIDSNSASLNSCIIQGGWSGAGSNNTITDPLFINAGVPAGPDSQWGTADDGLQPATTSPAINSGDQALLPLDLTDIDGDGNSSEVLPCDLNMRPRLRDIRVDRGAYEPLSPVIFHVRSGFTGDGFTWAGAMGDPQAAIEAAAIATNSQVWIAAGIYRPASWPNGGSADREKHFALRNNVPVYGGFPNGGDPGLPARNPAANLTVFSGNIGTLESTADNAYHVFYHPGGAAALDSSARLDGVRITGGNANVGPNFVYGAGMFNSQSSPMIVRCVFYDNTSANQAGGLYLGNSSNSSVVNCVFTQNHANEGGGLFVYEADPVLSNCLFVSNSASSAGGGGVRAFSDGNPSFIHCTFTENTYGALKNTSSTVSLSNCVLWGNSNYQISSTSATLDHCIIQGAWSAGGSNNIDADPLFANASDPAGPDGQWGTADDGLRLVLPSPAIQAGKPALLPGDLTDLDHDGNVGEALPLDLIGNARVIDVLPDAGAYEFVPGAMSLAYWRTLHFNAVDRADPAKEATVWGNPADPDGDGVPNSGEYLLLLNPAACDNPLGQLEIIEWWSWPWLQVVYTVGTDRTEVALTTEYSPDLSSGSWGDTDDFLPPFPHYLIAETQSTQTWGLLIPIYEARGFVRMGFTVNP